MPKILSYSSNIGIVIDEDKIPIRASVKQACALLGLDPLHIANEGKFIAIVDKNSSNNALKKIKAHPLGKN